MSQEKVFKALENLGLSPLDAKVYVFLGKRGPQKAKEITKSLKVPKQTLYRTVKNLQSKGLLTTTLEHPAKFAAVPFERVLDLFVKAKTEEAQHIEQGKKNLLSDWQAIGISEISDQSPRFTVLEGRNFIYPRLKQMIEETKNHLSIISPVSGLIRAEQFGILDAAFDHASKTNTKFRFLTELSEQNLKAMKLLLERIPKGVENFEGRTPELGLNLISRMLTKDGTEAMFFISQEEDRNTGADDVCLWTNSHALVGSFEAVFEDLWRNSTGLQKKIVEIENRTPSVKTCVFNDEKAAMKIYDKAIIAADNEIIMLTSSEGLFVIGKQIELLKRVVQKSLTVKIMAPITNDNLQVAQELSRSCAVRHISPGYPQTTIIDSKHLFQFEKSEDIASTEIKTHYCNTFYTNDSKNVEKTRNLLHSLWQNACSPSAIKLSEFLSPSNLSITPVLDSEFSLSKPNSPYRKMTIFVEEKPETLAQEDVVKKILEGKKYPAKNWSNDKLRFYGSCAHSLIHPPKYLNLPRVMIFAYNWNKQSSFGAEDLLILYLWLESSEGFAFSFSAAVTDNPKAVKIRKKISAGTPGEGNVQLVKKDQLQVKIHGNTAFVGWAIPIQLTPSRYVLPPSGILIEGYGRLKTSTAYFRTKSGVNMAYEGNGYDAFVTFFHPTSKCAGAGTDGIIGRDEIATYSFDRNKIDI